MSRPPQPAGTGRLQTGPADDRPPLAALSIRFDDGHRVDIHCLSRSGRALAVQTGLSRDGVEAQPPAEVIRLERAAFLTTSGRRGAAAGTIFTGGVGFDRAVDIVNALDLLSGGVLAAVGISDPDEARTILATLWRTK
jgi:hypothetical protein